jgi:hypothetical protein
MANQLNHHHTGHVHGALIEQLLKCATASQICAASCLDERDVTPMAHCIELDQDCSEICFMTAKLLIRDSEYAYEFLAICEKVCRHCAEVCSKHEHQHCKKCAEECIRCADDCHAQIENSL